MALAFIAVVFGLVLLVWSADRFVEGSASTARYFGIPPLLIGMVIVGFGTSAPEMMVSALAASQGNPGIALGNAYGSNITNIALILGLTALISPIAVHSQVLRKELPILTLVTALAAWQLWDGEITRLDAGVLLAVFGGLMVWTVWQGLRKKEDALGSEMVQVMEVHAMPVRRAVFLILVGLEFELRTPCLGRSLCSRRCRGEIRAGFRGSMEQGDEPGSLRSRLIPGCLLGEFRHDNR